MKKLRCCTFIVKALCVGRILVPFVLYIMSPSGMAQGASEYVVPLVGCPSQVKLTIPQEFSKADTPEKLKQRTTILETIHANKARKARYSEIFLANWDGENNLPYITVSSLGSLMRSQGKISETDWRKIRAEFLKSTIESRQSIIEKQVPRYKAGSAVDINVIRAEIPTLFEEGNTTIVIVGSSTSVVEGHILEVLSAAKLAYVHKCIAFVQISVDSSSPNPLRILNRYISQVSIN